MSSNEQPSSRYLGHFVRAVLSEGNGAVLLLTECPSENTLHVLKACNKSATLRAGRIERLSTEYRCLRMTAAHPFIVKAEAAFQTQNDAVLAMEFCPCGSLRDVLAATPNHNIEDESVRRQLVAEIVCAAHYMHFLEIVIRDLKPENILVRADGRIALADFDLSLIEADCHRSLGGGGPSTTIGDGGALLENNSLQLENNAARSSSPADDSIVGPRGSFGSTGSIGGGGSSANRFSMISGGSDLGSSTARTAVHQRRVSQEELEAATRRKRRQEKGFVGTPAYMAPEIVRDEVEGPHHTAIIDAWSLGVLIYELTFGRSPFQGTCEEDTLHKIRDAGRKLPWPGAPEPSKELRDLIVKLLERDPKKRLSLTDAMKHAWFTKKCMDEPPIDFQLLATRPPALSVGQYAKPLPLPPPFDKSAVVGSTAETEDQTGAAPTTVAEWLDLCGEKLIAEAEGGAGAGTGGGGGIALMDASDDGISAVSPPRSNGSVTSNRSLLQRQAAFAFFEPFDKVLEERNRRYRSEASLFKAIACNPPLSSAQLHAQQQRGGAGTTQTASSSSSKPSPATGGWFGFGAADPPRPFHV